MLHGKKFKKKRILYLHFAVRRRKLESVFGAYSLLFHKIVRVCFGCPFLATRQTIQFRKRNMNGEFALTGTPSFCVVHNAKTSNVAANQGQALGTRFQLRAFKARRGNIISTNITPEGQIRRPSGCLFEIYGDVYMSRYKRFLQYSHRKQSQEKQTVWNNKK